MKINKVILITGASSGIGEATARICAARECAVILAARRIDRLDAIVKSLELMDEQVLAVQTDVTEPDAVEQLVKLALDKFGRIDVLFNNAGFGKLNWLESLSYSVDILSPIRTNLIGLIHVSQAVLPYMIQQRNGHIINMGSLASLIGTPTYSVYAATKFGVRGFTEALRREVSVYNIHVSGIYPGGATTEFNNHAGIVRKTRLRTPAWLRLSADQVAEKVWWLINHPRRQLIVPAIMIPVVWFNILFPGLVDYAILEFFVKKEKGEKKTE